MEVCAASGARRCPRTGNGGVCCERSSPLSLDRQWRCVLRAELAAVPGPATAATNPDWPVANSIEPLAGSLLHRRYRRSPALLHTAGLAAAKSRRRCYTRPVAPLQLVAGAATQGRRRCYMRLAAPLLKFAGAATHGRPRRCKKSPALLHTAGRAATIGRRRRYSSSPAPLLKFAGAATPGRPRRYKRLSTLLHAAILVATEVRRRCYRRPPLLLQTALELLQAVHRRRRYKGHRSCYKCSATSTRRRYC
jgi:hypothetical protein